jgi:choline kinase
VPTARSAVTEAIILAAGNGDRFADPGHRSKLLYEMAGRPLIARTLEAASAAGIRHAHVVVGYRPAEIAAVCRRLAPRGLRLSFHLNDAWQLENGLSVLAARRAAPQRFAVLMGDHVFPPAVLRRMRELRLAAGESALAIDRRIGSAALVAEATRVLTDGDRVVAIGKALDEFDALDTGLFVFDTSLFEALERSCAAGDTTLTGGVRLLAAAGCMLAMPIGDARWFDIDTPGDLRAAEAAELSAARS